MDESVLGSEVQELNKLTLVTDMAFGKFAEALQSGLAESLADRPKKVDAQLFLDKVLTNANGDSVKVTRDLADAIYEDLIGNGYVKRGELTDKYYADKASGTVQVAEEVKDCAASVVSILSTIYDSHSVEFEDAHAIMWRPRWTRISSKRRNSWPSGKRITRNRSIQSLLTLRISSRKPLTS